MTAVDVCVLGSLNMDLVVRSPRLPRPGETLLGGPFERHCGGKGANQVVAVARAGAKAALIGAVGDDAYGAELLRTVGAEGVDVSGVMRRADCSTGVALITVAEQGENTIVVAPGANAELTESEVERSTRLIEGSRIVVAQLEVSIEAAARAAWIAGVAKRRFVLNAAPARELPREVLALVDVLVVNRLEACALIGGGEEESDEELARELVGLGVRVVAVTLGARGALLATRDGLTTQSAFAVDSLDTTGAGDAFVGALAVGMARGLDLATTLRRACAAGALATTRRGALPSMPRESELEALLASRRA